MGPTVGNHVVDEDPMGKGTFGGHTQVLPPKCPDLLAVDILNIGAKAMRPLAVFGSD